MVRKSDSSNNSPEEDLAELSSAINTMLADPESELSKVLARGGRIPCLTLFLTNHKVSELSPNLTKVMDPKELLTVDSSGNKLNPTEIIPT